MECRERREKEPGSLPFSGRSLYPPPKDKDKVVTQYPTAISSSWAIYVTHHIELPLVTPQTSRTLGEFGVDSPCAASSAALVRDKYAVQAIPMVDTKG